MAKMNKLNLSTRHWQALLYLSVAVLLQTVNAPVLSAPQPSQQIVATQPIAATASVPQSSPPIVASQPIAAIANAPPDLSSKHIIATTMQTNFKANTAQIWQALIDFTKYPLFFKRIKTVSITKRDGSFVYTESGLQPQIFVKCPIQHVVNDLSAAPKSLTWRMIDGNFKYLKGKWELLQQSPGLCSVKYTIYVDVGPVIPPLLVNFVVHHIQEEIVDQLKRYVEVKFSAG